MEMAPISGVGVLIANGERYPEARYTITVSRDRLDRLHARGRIWLADIGGATAAGLAVEADLELQGGATIKITPTGAQLAVSPRIIDFSVSGPIPGFRV